MAQTKTNIPKVIFHAQKIVQNARSYDHQNQYQKAITHYMQATKIFLVLLKRYPQMPFHRHYAQEIRLCLQRIKQLKPSLIDSTHSSKKTKESIPKLKEDKQYVEMRERVLRCRITPDPNLSWNDIIGLEEVIHHIHETVTYPLQNPDILRCSLKPPRAILLFGPPGCGKTHIIRVLAAQVKIPIFHISAGTLLSKWHGESQKMIRIVYETAWEHAPSIIFIDEFDGIFGSLGKSPRGGSEDSRIAIQIQKELQQFMDGLFTPPVNETVTIVATNYPWHLQMAQLRRFDRILYVHPPSARSILAMLNRFLSSVPHILNENELDWLSYELQGYTPDEIHRICTAAYFQISNRLKTFKKIYKDKPQRKLAIGDFLHCLKQNPVLKPILRFKECRGVGTIPFRAWNRQFGVPPIDYILSEWEKNGVSHVRNPIRIHDPNLAEYLTLLRQREIS
ncbi:MAG: AAA family ATPase [Candidatus Hodarchaeales archaeon]|jgi:SpoVK/Ycf46/Vps4 family AAA+-type ATPase